MSCYNILKNLIEIEGKCKKEAKVSPNLESLLLTDNTYGFKMDTCIISFWSEAQISIYVLMTMPKKIKQIIIT